MQNVLIKAPCSILLKNVHQRWCKAFSEAGKGLFYVFLDLPNTLVNGEQQVCEYV